ncbi:mucin-19-like isoform X3 [Cotesia glomerata]|uniref:mucin-19-like isoform X3 n=1 Tax=Cotesia glomerata TaxID=32391 RepID=UPI001D021440|nr:mucin-19-like isoform X3 [Cotesia glomerata]
MLLVLTLVLFLSHNTLGRYHEKTRFDRSVDLFDEFQNLDYRHETPEVFIDYTMRYVVFRCVKENVCYLEKMRDDYWKSILTGKIRPKVLYPSSSTLTLVEAWKLAGGRVVNFCNGIPMKLLEETQPVPQDAQDPFLNEIPQDDNEIFQKRVTDVVITPLIDRAKREIMMENREKMNGEEYVRVRRHAYPGKFRGQTQSQYLNFEKEGDKAGKAEAEATNESSRAVVSGTNGMGQAQSMTAGGSCEDCPGYQKFPPVPAGYTGLPGGGGTGLTVPGILPGINGPGVGYPGTIVPGTTGTFPQTGGALPGTYPGVSLPGTGQGVPGTYPGGVVPPGGQIPGGYPGTFPGGQRPGVGQPGSQVGTGGYPGGIVPPSSGPDAYPGGSGTYPGGSVPGTGQPGTYPGTIPGVGQPGTYPGVGQPGTYPGGSAPGSGQPGTYPGGISGVGQPGTYPGGSVPGTSQPGTYPGGMPGVGQPGTYPGGSVPGTGQPGTYPGGTPGVGQPGTYPGGMPGVGQPGTYPGGSVPGTYSGGIPGVGQPGTYPGSLPGSGTGIIPGTGQPGTYPGGSTIIPGSQGGVTLPGGPYPGGLIPPGGIYPPGTTYPGGVIPPNGIPGTYPGIFPPGTYPGTVPGFYPGGVAPGALIPGGYPGQYPSGVVSAAADDADSHASSEVKQNEAGTQASASADGTYGTGTAKSQVSGIYTGAGSFSAQAGINDGNKGAQTQVSGGKEGAVSSAQGFGGQGKSQTQVQLDSDTGATTTGSQSSGFNHDTSSQVQASMKGGMADAQANGEGSTSSQAQIGFQPYMGSAELDKVQSKPFKGGGTASAQSGTYQGQSQSQIEGSFQYGITYTGAAQAGSGSGAAASRRPFNFTNSDSKLFKSFDKFESIKISSDGKDEPTAQPELDTAITGTHTLKTSSSTRKTVLSRTPTRQEPQEAGLETGAVEYDAQEDEEYEDDDYAAAPGKMDAKLRTAESRKIHDHHGKHDGHGKQDSLRPKEGDLLQPGESLPGFTVPQGLRARVTSASGERAPSQASGKHQPQTVILAPNPDRSQIGKFNLDTRALKPGHNQNYLHATHYGKYTNPGKTRSMTPTPVKSNYYTVTNSVAGNMGDPRRKYEHRYYTKSSTCGYFTFSCNIVHGSNGRTKICKPKMPTYPDGTPMKC